ncbi:hypothetical protein GW17_00046366 [Ensete ventricosum]|nr:hypothetical protein GW17_00046366 [Ensete ventricosum]
MPTPWTKLKSVRELCSAHLGTDSQDYHAIRVGTQLERASDAPLEIDLTSLTHKTQIWLDEEASTHDWLRPRSGLAISSQLWYVRTQVRQMENELLTLTWALDALCVDLLRQAIEDYKKSLGFEMGLVRMGHISLMYGYQLALAWLWA